MLRADVAKRTPHYDMKAITVRRCSKREARVWEPPPCVFRGITAGLGIGW